MIAVIDFLPMLALVAAIAWTTIVHRRCLRLLTQAYEKAKIPFIIPSFALNAWRIFEPVASDTSEIVEAKKRLKAHANQQLRLCGPIFVAGFFLLAIITSVLKRTLLQR